MKPTDFRPTMSGRLVPTVEGQLAFVPAPLPPALTYDNDLALALSHADTALSELSGLGRHLPNPHLLIAPYTRREAILSSRIEGTRANLSDLLRDEAGEPLPDAPGAASDVREVRNYITALDYGIDQLKTLPISLRLIKGMHARLLADVRGDHARAGAFRERQNWIGGPHSAIHDAHFVPPPPADMLLALDQWEKFANTSGAMPDLIQCALLHQQFETIHPFIDGNGRLGRLLIILFLLQRGRLSQPLLYLSAYFEAHRRDYYDLLQRVRTDGDWGKWPSVGVANSKMCAGYLGCARRKTFGACWARRYGGRDSRPGWYTRPTGRSNAGGRRVRQGGGVGGAPVGHRLVSAWCPPLAGWYSAAAPSRP